MPRPAVAFGERTLPQPWVLGGSGTKTWLTFTPQRCVTAYEQHRCQVCGLPLERDKVMFNADGPAANPLKSRQTSGPPVHPACALVTLRHCPHMADWPEDVPDGWIFRGAGRGYLVDPPDDVHTFEPFDTEVDVDPAATPVTAAQLRALVRYQTSEARTAQLDSEHPPVTAGVR